MAGDGSTAYKVHKQGEQIPQQKHKNTILGKFSHGRWLFTYVTSHIMAFYKLAEEGTKLWKSIVDIAYSYCSASVHKTAAWLLLLPCLLACV